MWSVSEQSTMLAREYAPEVAVANNIERQSLLTMYAMRAYSYSEEEAYLKAGLDNLAKVKTHLGEAEELAAASPHLVMLREQISAAKNAVGQYGSLAAQTVERNKALTENRKTMDSAASIYMKNCAAFLESQNQALEKEIGGNEPQAKLAERHHKIILVNDVMELGNAVRVGNFRSQATRDPESFKFSLGNFAEIEKKLAELKTVTRQEVNLNQIGAIGSSAKEYQTAMTAFLANWLAREELNKKRGAAADAVLTAARENGPGRSGQHPEDRPRDRIIPGQRLLHHSGGPGRGPGVGHSAGDLHHPLHHQADQLDHRRPQRRFGPGGFGFQPGLLLLPKPGRGRLGAGRGPGGDLLLHGGDELHDQGQRRKRQPGPTDS